MERFLFFILFFFTTTIFANTILVGHVAINTVSLFDEESLQLLTTLPVGYQPHEVVVSPNGKIAVVSNFGTNKKSDDSLTIIDVETRSVVKTIQLPKYSRPHGLAFLNEKLILVTTKDLQCLLILNIQTNEIVRSIPLPGKDAHYVVVDKAKKYAYVASPGSGSVCKVDLENSVVTNDVQLGGEAEGLLLTKDEKLLLVTHRPKNFISILQTDNLNVVGKIATAKGPIRLGLFNDGKNAVVTNTVSGTAQVIDLVSFKVVNSFKTTLFKSKKNGKILSGILPVPLNISVRKDQHTAYVTHLYAGNITLVDLNSGAVLYAFESDPEPDGLAISDI